MQQTYNEFIENILNSRGRFACGDEYHERHHIIPKCMGGSNDEENLVDLFAQEHFEAHRMLALENPDNEKLVYAWWCMAVQANEHTKERYEINASEYAEVKLAYIDKLRMRVSGTNNPMYGISPKERMDEDTYNLWLSKITEKSSGQNNPMYGKHHSEETREKIRKKLTGNMVGEKNPFYGKRHSEETKEYLRKINTGKFVSQETRDKQSAKRKGKDNSNIHPLYCFEMDEFFWGAQDVRNQYPSITVNNVGLACNDPKRTCGRHPITNEKLHWRWATIEEYNLYINNIQKEIK